MINELIFPLDYILLAIGIIIIIFCFLRGFVSSILGLLTWIGSIIITIYFYSDLSNFFQSQLIKLKIFENYEQITYLLSNITAIPLIFLISLFILKKIRKIISSDLDKQILGIIFDKFFGLIFGFILNYIIFSTVIYFSKDFEFINFINFWLLENSNLISYLDNFNNSIINSLYGIEEDISN